MAARLWQRLPEPWLAVALLAVVSLRLVAALAHVAPTLVPDELIYQQAARAIADGDLPRTPAVLGPALSAPFWLVGESVGLVGMRLINLLGSVVGIVCAFRIARDLGYSQRNRWLATLLVSLTPGLVYAGGFLTEGLAFGAVLAWALALLRWTERRGSELPVVSLALVAAIARPQYLPLVLVGLVTGAVRRRHVPLHLLGLAAGVAFALIGLTHGVYRGSAFWMELQPWHLLLSGALLLGVTILGVGAVTVPLAFAAVRDRPELRAYALAAGLVVLGTVVTGAFWNRMDPSRTIERYTFTAAALWLILVPAANRLHRSGTVLALASLLALLAQNGELTYRGQSPVIATVDQIGVWSVAAVAILGLLAATRWRTWSVALQLAVLGACAIALDLQIVAKY